MYIIETKNRSLEETAALFDGVDADDLLGHQADGKEVRDDSEKAGSEMGLHIERLE